MEEELGRARTHFHNWTRLRICVRGEEASVQTQGKGEGKVKSRRKLTLRIMDDDGKSK